MSASLRRDYFDPLVLNERNGMWVSGHFRSKVLMHDGFTHADVVLVDYDEPTHIARMIAANTLIGEWEDDLLSALAGELQASGLGAGLANLTEKELAVLAGTPTVEDDTEHAGDLVSKAADLQAKWQVRPRDLFSIGRHRLYCGDSQAAESWRVLLGEREADMVWTDPPYNVAYEGAAGSMLNDAMAPAAYERFLTTVMTRALEVTKPGGAIYVAHADGFGRIVRNAFAAAGWREAQCLIWVKQAFVLGRQDHHWQHEPILYGWKPGAGHYWQGGFNQSTVIDDEPDLQAMPKAELIALVQSLRNARDTTVVREPRPSSSELHPTVKPLPLVARQIGNSSRIGELVLELFSGSGTTIVAAEQTGRVACAMELDPKFCAVALERASDLGLTIERIPHGAAA